MDVIFYLNGRLISLGVQLPVLRGTFDFTDAVSVPLLRLWESPDRKDIEHSLARGDLDLWRRTGVPHAHSFGPALF